MGLFSKRKGARPSLDELPPGEWLAASEQRFDAAVGPYYGTPDTMARGGHEHYARGEVGVALFFYAKAIDMLQTQYVFMEMRERRPSSDDIVIIEGFLASLGDSIRLHPGAPVHEVATVPRNYLDQIAGLTSADHYGRGRDATDSLLRVDRSG